MAAKSKANEITITRIYDAPVKIVWEAWTDPKKVAKWWGPRGFTLTTESKDLKPGGTWRYMMHGPDGTDYPNVTKYHEVEKYSRLVYDHGGTDTAPPLFRVTVNFTEEKGKTRMEMTMTLPTVEQAQQTKKFIKQAGGNSTWDRLAEYLEHEATGKEKFVINRSFNAPIAVVFDMWTNPEHFQKWLGPTGSEMKFIKPDINVGHKSFYSMRTPEGVMMYGNLEYREITKPNKIVYTQQFTDEKGNVSRHPFAPIWPETMLTTVQLTEEEDQQTRVTVTWEIEGKATAEEIKAFTDERAGMTIGWTGSFDKLEEILGD